MIKAFSISATLLASMVVPTTFAFALAGCDRIVADENCAAKANAKVQQDRQQLTAKIRELKASTDGDSVKDRQAFQDLMVEMEGTENRYKMAIRNCNAPNN